MNLARMASRNLLRNRRRSAIAGSAIALGLAMLIVFSGFADGVHGQMVREGVDAMAGHVVVQGQGWQARREAGLVVPGAAAVAERLAVAFPEARVLSRIYVEGLLASASSSAGVAISAVEPAREARVQDIESRIIEGVWLDGGPEGIVLGATLAQSLGLGPGDKVVFMAQHGPEVQSRLFRVKGLFRFGIDEIDGFCAFAPLGSIQAMLELGDAATQVSLHLPSARDTEAALVRVRAALPSSDLEILSWKEALPELYEWVVMDEAGLYLMLLIVAFIVSIGILNTVLMSVMERVREFGILLALGLSPARLTSLVLLESAILGVLSSAAGLGLGLLLNWPLSVFGFDYAAFAGGNSVEAAGVPMSTLVHSDLSPPKVAIFCLLSVVMTVLAALWPASRAARLDPVSSLRGS
jgi:ABC-type lipoprotein release transport system permease subunit